MTPMQIARELGVEDQKLSHEELFALYDAKELDIEKFNQVKNPFK